METDEQSISAVILAAGAGSRFGATKQLAELGGRPLLQHVVDAAVAVDSLEEIVVVLGHEAEAIESRIDFGRARPRACPGWREGLSASLRCGIDALGPVDAAVILLGDQPGVGAATIAGLMAALRPGDLAVRATFDGRPGHPVVVRSALFESLHQLRGDHGAREVLRAAGARELECADAGEGQDIDSPADLERFR